MPKERNYNPVQAQRKADKAKAAKKGKAELQGRRNEKLARKNPERIQKQIDDLEAATTNGGKISRHEEQVLEGLKKELKDVKKAREALGDKAPTFNRVWQPRNGTLGKRRRGSRDSTSDEDTPDEVKRIPMPRDTPPPIPKPELDKWYARRRAKRDAENTMQKRGGDNSEDSLKPTEERPKEEAKTVYEAAPIIRDLRKEAVSAFTPSIVQRKMGKVSGRDGLIEPEEADALEREGYLSTSKLNNATKKDGVIAMAATVEDAEDNAD